MYDFPVYFPCWGGVSRSHSIDQASPVLSGIPPTFEVHKNVTGAEFLELFFSVESNLTPSRVFSRQSHSWVSVRQETCDNIFFFFFFFCDNIILQGAGGQRH